MILKPCIVGIDFGTTSLSSVVINVKDMHIERVFSRNTDAYIPFTDHLRKEQSLEKLTVLFFNLIDEINSISGIKILAYGFTGQMHGIIGLDSNNKATTNLVTWQDKSGETILSEGKKLLDKIKELAGKDTIANGYGVVSLYKWLYCDNNTHIKSFCTVADYFAKELANSNKVVMSPTMAHSIGLFDLQSNTWDESLIKKLGFADIIFPTIVKNSSIAGYTEGKPDKIPVICAIGDNQASFWGSVGDKEKSILLNVGTGTQLSFLIKKEEFDIYKKYIDGFETQLRPYDNDFYLIATSFVNGGSVYESLFNFFRETGVTLFDLYNMDEDVLWKNMEEAGKDSLNNNNPLSVVPLLEGQRKDSKQKGSISDLVTDNFHPGDFIAGFLSGLATYYKTGFFPELTKRISYISGGGNGLKRNSLLCKIIEKEFGYPLHLTTYNEEAAVGAALNAAAAIGMNDIKIK